MSTLLPAPISAGRTVRAQDWNALVAAVRAMRPQIDVGAPMGVPNHPWRTRVTQQGDKALVIHVEPGLCNDRAAAVSWRVQGDARGELPTASRVAWLAARAARPLDPWLELFWDRALYELEAPFLWLPADPTSPEGRDAWRLAPRVPLGIAQRAPKEAQWYEAAVVLAAFPWNVAYPVVPPKVFRVYAGRARPSNSGTARAGEQIELARLYAAVSEGRVVARQVEQRVFWHLGCTASEPSLQIPGTPFEIPSFGSIGAGLAGAFAAATDAANQAVLDGTNAILAGLEMEAGTVEFWTS